MPKIETDYSNTIIYKITCKDTNIKDLYVGHTTNFVQRKYSHEKLCINKKSPNYKCKLYETIRNNGGWENWNMEVIDFFKCHDHYQARQKEQEYFISLNATLNSIEPMSKPKVNLQKTTTNMEKNNIFICEYCNFKCNKQSSFIRHKETNKHKRNITGNSSKNVIKISKHKNNN